VKIILIGTAHPFRGGLASFNERLMTQFQEEGHEVMILNFTLQYPSFLFPGKTQFSDSPAPENLHITRQVNAINPFSWIRNGLFLLSQKPDFILFKYWLPFMAPCFGVISMIAGWRKSIKRLAILDNIIPHEKRFLDSFLTSFFVWNIDAFLAMSHSVASDVKRFTLKKKCVLSPHPLFDNFGPPIDKMVARNYFGLNEDQKVLLFFGFIRPYKGLDLLIEGLAKTKSENIKLIIAGPDDGYLTYVKSQIVGVESILLLPAVTGNNKNYLLKEVDVFLLPSYSEGFSVAALEAIAYGKACIFSPHVGFSKLALQNNAAIICETNEVSLREKMDNLSNNVNLRINLGLEAKRLYEANFTTEGVGKQFLELVINHE
jgi:glycosyltransferase involved in cell wall biosynthesis